MTASRFEPVAVAPLMSPTVPSMAMSRPQVGIERLPTRRMSNEPRESMNCKSCRKRKIKCNRLRPACEACQVFQCPCIYDAVPKKRGPKTDVLEALLKRVDGLEQKLKDQNATDPGTGSEKDSTQAEEVPVEKKPAVGEPTETPPEELASQPAQGADSVPYSPASTNEPSPGVQATALLDTYFTRFHAKPYHVLDESSVRQRLQLNQLPPYLTHAIYAVAARYTPHPGGYQSAVWLSENYATRARREIDTDEPSVDALQSLLLLVTAFTAAGKGKKAYMLLTNAVGMAMALELHREMEAQIRVTPVERETRRRLFWSCYLLDRFMSCGSKRPSLIGDQTILLRLPCWSPSPATAPLEGDFFQSGSNLHYLQGAGRKSQGGNGMLIDISRILGITNRYLAAGGVKGDSHFPWHALSNLSKIRSDLDVWASGTEDAFSSLDGLFGHPDSTVLVLSKLIYHLIHCLVYRPFLPIDLAELAGTGQHQSWQIEATNMCFLHANAIAELVELGNRSGTIEWPAFVGYCICTAGTVHIHGTHYNTAGLAGEMSVFTSSGEFLSREMQQLSELRYPWASVQHQRETLQGIYNAHSELVSSLVNNPARYSPVFHLEDFFDRYANIGGPGGQTFNFDAANISLSDVIVDFPTDAYTGRDLFAPRTPAVAADAPESGRPSLKRKKTGPQEMKRPGLSNLPPLITVGANATQSPRSLPTPSQPTFPGTSYQVPPVHNTLMSNSTGVPLSHGHNSHLLVGQGLLDDTAAGDAAAAAGFSLAQHHRARQGQPLPQLSTSSFSPQFHFTSLAGPGGTGNGGRAESQQLGGSAAAAGHYDHAGGSYDPMFGTLPTNAFSSPAAWHGGGGGSGGSGGDDAKPAGQVLAHSPDERSTNGSAGEEKDPFLSLLEQLAESEGAMGGGPGSELDFFLGIGNGP